MTCHPESKRSRISHGLQPSSVTRQVLLRDCRSLCWSRCARCRISTNKPAPAASPAAPSDEPNSYRNTTFGFRYQIPYGWVDRTKEMQEGNDAGKAEVLLAVFERPPEATGDTINSAVVIASESAASYPGLKRAEDYLGPLTELATAKGFKAEGEPYALEVESRQLLRADFIKPQLRRHETHHAPVHARPAGQGSDRLVHFHRRQRRGTRRSDGRLHFGVAKSTRRALRNGARESLQTQTNRLAGHIVRHSKNTSLSARKNAVYALDSASKYALLC